jgi:hypothetical protein
MEKPQYGICNIDIGCKIYCASHLLQVCLVNLNLESFTQRKSQHNRKVHLLNYANGHQDSYIQSIGKEYYS